jgi:hypothetical protein
MCGLCTWPIITQCESPNPKVYVNKAGEAPTKADPDNLVRQLWLDEHADYYEGDWRFVCHPETHRLIHDFDISCRSIEKDDDAVGFSVDEFHSKIGKIFPILIRSPAAKFVPGPATEQDAPTPAIYERDVYNIRSGPNKETILRITSSTKRFRPKSTIPDLAP